MDQNIIQFIKLNYFKLFLNYLKINLLKGTNGILLLFLILLFALYKYYLKIIIWYEHFLVCELIQNILYILKLLRFKYLIKFFVFE